METPTPNHYIEPLPSTVERKLSAVKPPDETVLLQVVTDMADERVYGERWLVLTEKRVLLLSPDGPDGTVDLPVSDVSTAKLEGLVGGGRLDIERKEGAPACLYYSGTLAPKFAEVAEGIRQVSKGEPLALRTEVERTRCLKCRRLLPEKNCTCPACVKKTATFRRIAGYLRPYRGRAVLMVLIAVLGTVAELLPPLITRRIIDDVLTPRAHFGLLVWLVLGLFGVRILVWMSEVGGGWVTVYLGSRMTADIRMQLYEHLQRLVLKFFDKRPVGSLMSRLTNDAGRLESFLVNGLPFVFTNALLLVGILGFLFYTSWMLTIYVLLPVPIIMLGTSFIWRRMRRYWDNWSVQWSRFLSHLNESISGIRIVKAFAQEGREMERFSGRNVAVLDADVLAGRGWFVFWTISNFLMSLGVFLVWYFGGSEVVRGRLTLGALMAFISYIWMLYRPLRWFSEINQWMTRSLAGAERIFEIIDTPAESSDDPDAVLMPRMEGRVAFQGVSFGYDRVKPVLKEVSLEVAPGEMIGLVGRSGVGKSTMINLICRFYDADRGTLTIDGVDIRKVRLKDLRSQIGMVHQESFLFNGTIAENIGYGKQDPTFEEIVRAARAANAHEFIVDKPDGYDTQVGERGNKLSGGEEQRIAIARAILHDPRILILDEATSSLDAQTEKKIQEAIARLIQGRTTFAIAHRLSTLRSANRLVVLEDGKITEVGTHAELMAKEGVFFNMVKTQRETSAVVAVGGGKDDPNAKK